MGDPLEFCIDASGYIAATITSEFQDFRFWNYVEKISSYASCLELYISDGKPPAFAHVRIDCSIPPSSFSERVLSVQVRSTEWHENECPGIMLVGQEMPSLLEGEGKKVGCTPAFGLSRSYGVGPDEKTSNSLELAFQEMLIESDIEEEQSPDYEAIAEEVLQQIEAIHRVLKRVKELGNQHMGE